MGFSFRSRSIGNLIEKGRTSLALHEYLEGIEVLVRWLLVPGMGSSASLGSEIR